MSNKNLTYTIGADIGQLRREMEASGTLTRKWQRELDSLEQQQRKNRSALTELGQGITLFGVAAAGGLALAGKAAMDWETAFTGVRKTVDGSPQEIAALEGELRKLARTLPATHEEIAGVAEAAGQLGIKRKDIAAFTKVMVDLGNTTNLTAEDAATGLAKLSNIMGTGASDVDRLGSALVALGNDGASTEADILAMALRIAGAGHQIGLTEAQVLGFASALSSVGIEAESGGSAISRVMIDMEQAVRSGGDQLDLFAKVAGVSSASFALAYKTDAGAAITSFIAGLGKMQQSGQDVFGVLADLGFGEIRVRDALLRTSGASDMLTKSLQVGTSAWAENKALTDEAAKRYETSASRLQVAGNQIKDVLIDVGAALAPIAVAGAQGIGDLAHWFQELPGPVKEVVTWVGAGATVVALFGGAALIAVPKVLAFRETMRTLESTSTGVASGLGKFGLFMSGPWGAAIGIGVALLGAFGAASGGASRRQEDLAAAGKSVADAIREQNGVINDTVRAAAAKEAGDKNLLSNAKKLGIELGAVTDAVLGQGTAYTDLQTKLKGVIAAGTEHANAGKGGSVTRFSEEATAAKTLSADLATVHDGLGKSVEDNKNVAEASKGAAGATKNHAQMQADLGKQAEAATKALDELIKALNAVNGTNLTYREAQRGYIDQLGKTADVLTANGKTLDINTKAGRDNAEALDAQAKAAGALAEAAAREAESTGGAAAGSAALKNSLLASHAALIETAIRFGMSEAAAKAYADKVLGIPQTSAVTVTTPGSREAEAELGRVRDAVNAVPKEPEVNVGVISDAAQKKLQDLGFTVRTLPDGTVVVGANDQAARDNLQTLLTRINNATATLRIQLSATNTITSSNGQMQFGYAYGGVARFDEGGVYGHNREVHRPEIARAVPGMVRVWAEPETDSESYIPWAVDRRPQAVGVLGETADAFGYTLVPKSQIVAYAQGGTGGGGSSPGTGGGGWSGPSTLVVVDADGQLIGRMRVEAAHAMAEESREINLRGGRA